MNSLNSILVEGNLTRDPVLATTPKGTAVCNFSVASNRFYRSDEEMQKEVSFFDVEVWSRLAERCSEELTKGRGVRVVGRLKQDRWQDKEEKPRSRVKIVAEHVEFRRPRVVTEAPAGEVAELEEAEHVAEGEREPAEVVFIAPGLPTVLDRLSETGIAYRLMNQSGGKSANATANVHWWWDWNRSR